MGSHTRSFLKSTPSNKAVVPDFMPELQQITSIHKEAIYLLFGATIHGNIQMRSFITPECKYVGHRKALFSTNL